MPELSIIVPVYNTPTDALQRCFDSVKSLQALSYEVILVDDGSEESAASFCREYAEKTPGFVCLRKENGGVSSARNHGLDHARGQYILFLDADDTLLTAPITRELLQPEPDLVLFDIQLTEHGKSWTWYAFSQPAGDITKQTLLQQLIVDKSLNGPVAKLYRRQIVEENQLRFDTTFVTGEDWDFVSNFAMLTQSAWYEKQPVYRYYRDEDTGKKRTIRFPDTVLDNTIAMFEKKLELVKLGEFSQTEAEAIRSGAAVIAVENLFNTAADYLVSHLVTRQRKEKLRKAVARASAYLQKQAPRKTKIKAWVARYLWIGVYPLAYLRELYLKHKEWR